MTVSSIVVMLMVGLVLGILGRLVVPGPLPIPIWMTMLIGVGAAFAGTLLARALGVSTATSGIDWLELLVQVVAAAIGTVVAANLYSRRASRYFKDLGTTTTSTPRRAVPPVSPAEPQRRPPTDPPAQPQRMPQTATSAEPAAPRRMQQPVPPTPPPSRVFVSYRRIDTRYAAKSIAERLRSRFGTTEVFMDVDSLAKGADFVEGVRSAIGASAVVLVLIGDRWLSVVDERGMRKLDDPDDNVRMEIEHALQWQKHVLPVLLDGVGMPRADDLPPSLARFPRLNGIHLNYESLDDDVAALVREVARLRP